MFFLRFALLNPVLLLLLAGCGGSGGPAASTTGSGSTTGTTTTTPAYTGAYVFVVQNTQVFGARSNGALLRFRADSNGVVSPDSTITAKSNGGFRALAADSTGTVYSSAFDTRDVPILVSYSSTASGETAAGRSNVLGQSLSPGHLAFGPTGDLVITELDSVPVLRYTVSASSIALAQSLPRQSSGAKATTLFQTFGAAQDSAGYLYVADSDGIKIFSSTATGDVAPSRVIVGPTSTLVPGSLTNPNFYALPVAIAINSLGEIYVAVSSCTTDPTTKKQTCTNAIQVFAPGASGDAAPIRTISGDKTLFNGVVEMTFDKGGNLYVLDYTTSTTGFGTGRISRWSGTANGNVAPLNSFTSAAWTETSAHTLAVVN